VPLKSLFFKSIYKSLTPIFMLATLATTQARKTQAPGLLQTPETNNRPASPAALRETAVFYPVAQDTALEKYISDLYGQIDFNGNRLDEKVFDEALRGYLNLKSANKLSPQRDVLTVCDFNLPSTRRRLWVIDLKKKQVLFNTYVAHGQGSGDVFARHFSNAEASHESSLGFYVTGKTYQGHHGTSLYLDGLDTGFNDAARDRNIVVHGASYVGKDFIRESGRLGRSWGCPAIPPALTRPIIDAIKDSTCLFIAHDSKEYRDNSCWLNKRITAVPASLATRPAR
jgi:hypothetical protein